jgi:hypothetical protein
VKTINRREFVATATVVGAGAVFGREAFAFQNQGATAGTAGISKPVGHEVVASHARPFPMKNVRLQPGAFSAAAEANRKYLKTLSPDRLLHTFR